MRFGRYGKPLSNIMVSCNESCRRNAIDIEVITDTMIGKM